MSDLFWRKMISKVGAIDVSEPALPLRRKAPMRFDERLCDGDVPETAKDLHHQEIL